MNATLARPSEIILKCGTAFARLDKIVQFNMNEDYILDLEDVREINDSIGKLTDGKKAAVLFMCGNYTNVTQEVVNDSLNPDNFRFTVADAFVVKSFSQRLIANFYITIMKPPVPTKYFKTEEEAVKWIKSVRWT